MKYARHEPGRSFVLVVVEGRHNIQPVGPKVHSAHFLKPDGGRILSDLRGVDVESFGDPGAGDGRGRVYGRRFGQKAVISHQPFEDKFSKTQFSVGRGLSAPGSCIPSRTTFFGAG
ncbi:MAG: hypothetical protein QF466_04595 [Desulfobacterales bacterium]|nr:hypothetical protein [Desulfobacterales bacterium]